MSANTTTTATAPKRKPVQPTFYKTMTQPYERLMATKKSDWDTHMVAQRRTMLDDYEHYKRIGKLIARIAAPAKVREYYRLGTPGSAITSLRQAQQAYTEALLAHVADPSKPAPKPTRPQLPEWHWELVVETDLRDQNNALELLRLEWEANPMTTAQRIVEVVSDWPQYRSHDIKLRIWKDGRKDNVQYRIEVIKPILRHAMRQILDNTSPAPDWANINKPKPEMRKVPMVQKNEIPFSVAIPGNLQLLETEFDIYQRHQTCVYVAGDDGQLVGLNLPLDNDFARVRAKSRNYYDHQKYNPRYVEQLFDNSNDNGPVRRSLRFLAEKVAEGRRVKIVTDQRAAHGHALVQAIAALVPEEEKKLHKSTGKANAKSGTHHMDDRDYIDEYDRPARHIWRSRKEAPPKEGDPIKPRTLYVTKQDAMEIKWWNLYWMTRSRITYLVYSVRQFRDSNGIKKHVVIFQPTKVFDKDGNIVRKHRAHWMIAEDADLRRLCNAPYHMPQYDDKGNIIGYRPTRRLPKFDGMGNLKGYTDFRQEPESFRGELPAQYKEIIPAWEAKKLGYKKSELRSMFKRLTPDGMGGLMETDDPNVAPRFIGYTLRPQPLEYNSVVRNTFAYVLATVRRKPSYRRVMEKISQWEYEREHEFEHKTLKNATQDPNGSKNYHEDEGELSNGRFDSNDALLNPTYEEFAEATLHAEGTRDALDYLADGEISLATAAELATIASKPSSRPQELAVEEALDKQLKKLQATDRQKADLRKAQEMIDVLSMLKRHPELEAHMSRELNPEGRICKIWNIDPNMPGYVHTPLSQMLGIKPILVRKDGANLTAEEQAALPENEGRRYIAAEWEAQEPEALFMVAPNPWKEMSMRNGKRIYQLKRNYKFNRNPETGKLRIAFRRQHTQKQPPIYRKAA
ncbi:MAG: hypothetical protein U0X20_16950 [Caldilineaceae bacterium]